MRIIQFIDGSEVIEGFTNHMIEETVRPNDICVVEPMSPMNNAKGHKGRKCTFTGHGRNRQGNFNAVVIWDDTGKFGEIHPAYLKTISKA